MSVRALSTVKLCAEQKLVPPLPMRQLSRMLSGVAAKDDAAPARAAIAAVIPIAVLLIWPSDQSGVPGLSIIVSMPPLVTGCSRSFFGWTGAVLIKPSETSVLPSSLLSSSFFLSESFSARSPALSV
jgi:hypothetical protein